jgi:ATP-dependent Clp protease ATP-binding subunit ClpC
MILGQEMFERFTDRARKVMALANQEAQRFDHEFIGTEHILLGLLKEGSGAGATILKNRDVDIEAMLLETEQLLKLKRGPDKVASGQLPETPCAIKVIEYAIEEARSLNHDYLGTEHILLGLLRESEGIAAQVLMNLGLKLEDVRRDILKRSKEKL